MLNFYPQKVFKYFEKIASIPHGSYNTDGIADYLEGYAKDHNFDYIRDSANNVIIYKPAGKGFESKEAIILQGHTDMVCASEGDFDFVNNSIAVDSDGEYVYAKGTTLGADNGIAVAMMLAVLESDVSLPPLECVFTSDEEVGMLGAIALDMSQLKGKRMINVDSEAEGIFTIGCAGGVSCELRLPVSFSEENTVVYKFELCGLHGGHSGVEIDNGYVNGIRLIADYMAYISDNFSASMIDISAGAADNAIPKNGSLIFACDRATEEELRAVADEIISLVKKEYNEPECGYILTNLGCMDAVKCECTKEIIGLIKSLPNGVLAYEENMPESVKTSCNTGVVCIDNGSFILRMSLRSSVNSERENLAASVCEISKNFGASCILSGSYPAWEPVSNSPLCAVASEVFMRMYGKEPVIEVIHAGLECSVFSDRIQGFDCISIGPDMVGIHTPEEKLNIASAGRVYDYICELLKNI